MRFTLGRIRGAAFVVWHARHMLYHMLVGLIWAWFLREMWDEFNIKWILLAMFGSVFPDIEHLFYFFTYGKSAEYTKAIKKFLHDRQWRMVTVFIENGHKYNTDLSYHNIYFMLFLIVITAACFVFDLNSMVVFVGAMVSHYLFDIVDDYVQLGYLNENWRRWGRKKQKRNRSKRLRP